jgi:hypothetical protein
MSSNTLIDLIRQYWSKRPSHTTQLFSSLLLLFKRLFWFDYRQLDIMCVYMYTEEKQTTNCWASWRPTKSLYCSNLTCRKNGTLAKKKISEKLRFWQPIQRFFYIVFFSILFTLSAVFSNSIFVLCVPLSRQPFAEFNKSYYIIIIVCLSVCVLCTFFFASTRLQWWNEEMKSQLKSKSEID